MFISCPRLQINYQLPLWVVRKFFDVIKRCGSCFIGFPRHRCVTFFVKRTHQYNVEDHFVAFYFLHVHHASGERENIDKTFFKSCFSRPLKFQVNKFVCNKVVCNKKNLSLCKICLNRKWFFFKCASKSIKIFQAL